MSEARRGLRRGGGENVQRSHWRAVPIGKQREGGGGGGHRSCRTPSSSCKAFYPRRDFLLCVVLFLGGPLRWAAGAGSFGVETNRFQAGERRAEREVEERRCGLQADGVKEENLRKKRGRHRSESLREASGPRRAVGGHPRAHLRRARRARTAYLRCIWGEIPVAAARQLECRGSPPYATEAQGLGERGAGEKCEQREGKQSHKGGKKRFWRRRNTEKEREGQGVVSSLMMCTPHESRHARPADGTISFLFVPLFGGRGGR